LRAALGTGQTTALSPEQAVVSSQLGPFKGQRESVERHYREMQYIGAATLLVYVWNIFDAYYFHPGSSQAGLPPETPSEKVFLRNSVEQMSFGQVPSDRAVEHRTNLGYEIYF
jgi:hypothetical protein